MKNTKLFDYDDRSIESIVNYSEGLKNRSFKDVLDDFDNSSIKDYFNYYENNFNSSAVFEPTIEYNISSSSKGSLGNIIERCFFGYKPNPKQEADFPKCGLELKVTPIDTRKDGTEKAGERLSITNISYNDPVIDDFYLSHVWEKIKNILIVSYLRDKSASENQKINFLIKYIYLYKPPKEDLEIIIDDYKQICSKLKKGQAGEIHEGDTTYLGACTKGATARSSMRNQYYGTKDEAPKRSFCFRQPYMDYILNNYIIPSNKKKILNEDESIIKNGTLQGKTFEETIASLIDKYKGISDEKLASKFYIPYTCNKAMWDTLTFKMLGLKSNRAREFEKAGIKVKTIRIENNGSINEQWELPNFKFMELKDEIWENSTLRDYLLNTKFFIVFFKSNGKNYVVDKTMFWHVDEEYLDKVVKKEWEENVKIINEGIKFRISGDRVFNNLPNSSKTKFLHIRPHADKSAYLLNNGFKKGNIEKDGDLLPNGEIMTKQSFWINKSYFKNLY